MEHRLYGARWYGVALGLVATLAGLAVAELLVGLISEAVSPVVAVGQEVIDIVPASVKEWAIETFGQDDKLALVVGTLVILGVIGSLVGHLMASGSRAASLAIAAVVGLIGIWAVAMRPSPTFAKFVPTIAGTAVTMATLRWLGTRLGSPRAVDAVDSVDAVDTADGLRAHEALVPRRRFMRGAATVGLLSVVGAAVGRVLQGRSNVDDERAALVLPEADDRGPTIPPPATTNPSSADAAASDPNIDSQLVDETDFGYRDTERWEVANGDFYRIDTALVVPQVSKDDWQLRIHGMVERELKLTFADLLERPMIERHITLSCVSNEVGGGLVGNALFQGVRMKDVLDEAGVQAGATQVVSRSIDGWSCGSPTSVITDGRDAMLAIAMNGEPLPAEHGYPVRLVVPGLYGYVSATKWVTEIELTRWEDFDGYWIPRGWSKEGPVKTMARIDRPRHRRGVTPSRAGLVDIAGVAWAVHRGISRVEISIDDGEWRECELAGVPSDDTWRQWRYRWDGAPVGQHTVVARAYDGTGEPQPLGPKAVAPDGAEGYHRVRFNVAE